MKFSIKHNLMAFFSSTILLLQFTNALHFVLIDHSVNTEWNTQKHISHSCHQYVLVQNYITTDPNLTFELPIWIIEHSNPLVYYNNAYQFVWYIESLNKGPPQNQLNI